jgi:predicted nuclease with TOPRIM domain
MERVLKFIKLFPWWFWVLVVIGLIFLWQALSGWAMSKKYFDLAVQGLRTEQAQIIKDKDEWIKTMEAEIKDKQAEIDQIKKEKAALQIDRTNSAAEVVRLKRSNDDLKRQIREIIVSDDPDRIIDDLRKYFPSINKF